MFKKSESAAMVTELLRIWECKDLAAKRGLLPAKFGSARQVWASPVLVGGHGRVMRTGRHDTHR